MKIILLVIISLFMTPTFSVVAQMRVPEKQEQREELPSEERAKAEARKLYENLKRNLKTQFTREQEEQIIDVYIKYGREYRKMKKERWNISESAIDNGEVVIGGYDSLCFYHYKIGAAQDAALGKVFTEKQNDAFVSYWEKNDELRIKMFAYNRIVLLASVFGRKFGTELRLVGIQRESMRAIAIESMQKKYENWKRHNYQLCDSLLAVDRQIDEAELAAFKKILTKEQYKTYVEYLKNE